ncbi:glycosyltransferase family 39 protein [Brasilonema sp. CT11]|nr:glycosyltransferase family 39 protein [Brasilonema sp. CT11]
MSKKTGTAHLLSINNIYPYAFLGILLLAGVLGLIGLNKGLWNDEYFTIHKISHPNIVEMFRELRTDVHPPLYYILLYFWAQISKKEEFLRVFSVLLSLGTLAIVMNWIKQYSHLASLLAGVYLATTPIMLRYSQELKAYPLLVFATSLAFLFASHIIAKPEKFLGYIGLCWSLFVAVCTHLVGIMLIPSIVCFIYIQALLLKKKIQYLKLAVAIIIPTITFLYLKFFWLKQVQEIQDTWWWMPDINLDLISSTAKYVFGLSSLYLPITIIPYFAFLVLGIFAGSVFFGDWKISFPFLAATIIFWVVILVYSLIDSPIFYYRIILPSLVPFVAFVALQIATIPIQKIKIASIVCLIILSLSYTANWVTHQAYKPVEENREVARLVELEWQKNDFIIFYPDFIQGTVNYYFKNIPLDKQIVVLQTNNFNKINNNINTKLSSFFREREIKDIFFVAMDGNIEGYNELLYNVLNVLKYKMIKKTRFHLFLIKGHDSYFSNQFESVDKFIVASESKLGKPYFYQDFGMYVSSKYMAVLNRS